MSVLAVARTTAGRRMPCSLLSPQGKSKPAPASCCCNSCALRTFEHLPVCRERVRPPPPPPTPHPTPPHHHHHHHHQVVLRKLALALMPRLDDELRHSTAEDAAFYEHRLQVRTRPAGLAAAMACCSPPPLDAFRAPGWWGLGDWPRFKAATAAALRTGRAGSLPCGALSVSQLAPCPISHPPTGGIQGHLPP